MHLDITLLPPPPPASTVEIALCWLGVVVVYAAFGLFYWRELQ